MRSILIGGYYGGGNVGDEAVLASVLQDLRGIQQDLVFTVLSWNPDETRQSHQVKAIYWRDIAAIVDAVLDSDLILVGGGGLFQDHWGLDPRSYLRINHGGISSYGSLPILAQLVGVPCMLYGVGIGPLQREISRTHTCKAAERCQLVTLRDQHSYQLLEAAGFDPNLQKNPEVIVLADPAFGFSSLPAAKKEVDQLLKDLNIPESVPMLGVNLRYWDHPHPPEEWLPGIARGVAGFTADKPELEVLLIPFQVSQESVYTDDLDLYQRLSQSLPNGTRVHLFTEKLSPSVCQELIGRCSLVLGMRLHALIMAVNKRIPVVALPYDPKVETLMEEVGLGDFCLPSYTPSPDHLSRLLQNAWDERHYLKGKMQTISAEMKPKAKANAKFALELLDYPVRPPAGIIRSMALQRIKLLEKVDRLFKGQKQG